MSFCGSICDALLEYNTSKIVLIKSKKVGLINRLIQLAIICYVIGFVIIYKKGYQETEKPYSSVTTKVKGVSFTNLTLKSGKQFPLYGGPHVWDDADYVIPPEENGAFFIATDMIITPDQTQSICPESPDVKGEICRNDSECPANQPTRYGHGIRTGKCVPYNKTMNTCQVYAWCPIESDVTPMPIFTPSLPKGKPLLDARNFTVLIKNSVQFPNFKISKRNIDSNADSKTLKNCMYDKKNSPLCPIFKLQTIVEDAGENFTQLAFEGGVMGIIINWQCDFDSLSYSCEPVYSFRRLDDAHAPIAGGYNFRHANYYVKNDTLHRTLFKSYGIRFVVTVIGQGGKFSVIPLFLNLGSGLALLGIATVLCDIVVLYVLRRKNFYREKKYQYVTENTEQETFFNKYGSTP
ncbi:P2X purinoceptor 4-like [Actinia tenebrosa]|uniref:P2X purinoceptor 4-like n=1 Tax=Actinia tenebrosa TaxID=6105 RepID=A0A6P8HG07_ACTTE|nr:P2X purinoceptor 4-like [Actinia tenebrosa]